MSKYKLGSIARKIKGRLLRKGIINYPRYYKRTQNIDISPIFILGSNRSGTSLISSLISQHPQVEGIFNERELVPTTYSSIKNHVIAYCTSHHVWGFLIKLSKNWVYKDEGILWGHPKHISKYYRDKPKSRNESLNLANAIQYYRKTENIPLLNSHFNMFRIGLIKKTFPSAKFILIIRNYKEYITSCADKWEKQNNINLEYPKIGLHWLTLNISAIYDLKKYAEGNYCIIDHSSLFDNENSVNRMLNNKIGQIDLEEYHFNLDVINKKYRRFPTDIRGEDLDHYFAFVNEIMSFEKKLINE